jgi:hypothetical protein
MDEINPSSEANLPLKDELDSMLQAIIYIKGLNWPIFGAYYPKKKSILYMLENLIHKINAYQNRLK